jgi:hypothetical protein
MPSLYILRRSLGLVPRVAEVGFPILRRVVLRLAQGFLGCRLNPLLDGIHKVSVG